MFKISMHNFLLFFYFIFTLKSLMVTVLGLLSFSSTKLTSLKYLLITRLNVEWFIDDNVLFYVYVMIFYIEYFTFVFINTMINYIFSYNFIKWLIFHVYNGFLYRYTQCFIFKFHRLRFLNFNFVHIYIITMSLILYTSKSFSLSLYLITSLNHTIVTLTFVGLVLLQVVLAKIFGSNTYT